MNEMIAYKNKNNTKLREKYVKTEIINDASHQFFKSFTKMTKTE